MTVAPILELDGDPVALQASAHRLATSGAHLRTTATLLERTTAALAQEGWSGPAAEAFGAAAEHLLAAGQGAAALLDRVEAALLAYATALETARIDQARQLALGLPAGPEAGTVAIARLRLAAVVSEAVQDAHTLRHRLAAAAPPPGPVAATPAGALPTMAQPAPAGEVVVTLGVLAALLAAPRDPTASGVVPAPVRAALAQPLRRLLASDQPGWSRRLAVAAPIGRRPGAARARGQVAAAVAGALRPAGGDGAHPDGWRLPGRG